MPLVDDDWTMPLWEEDRITRHFGWVKGVPHCPVGMVCEHGWMLTQKIVDGWAEAARNDDTEVL